MILCISRRHHCIHRPRSVPTDGGRCLLTEYNDTYREFVHAPVTQPIKPHTRAKVSSGPFERSTMYRDTFIPHKYMVPQKPNQNVYIKPSGNMHTLSSYRTDYLEKKVQKPKLAKPVYKPVASGCPFDGSTVNNETYKAWDVPKIESVHPPHKGIRKSSAKFDHHTTVQHDYPGYYSNLGREAVRPPETSLTTGNGPMSNETTHRLDYDKKDGGPEKSAKPPERSIRNPGSFDHETTNQHAYPWPHGQAADSCKPVQYALKSNQPFHGNTTHKEAFRRWDVPRMEACKPQVVWQAPNQSFTDMTTFRHDFQGRQVAKAKSSRPEYARLSPGEFHDSTTHNETYRPWKYSQRESNRPKGGYQPPVAPFDGQTIHKSDFRGEKAQRPEICIPKENGIGVTGGQDYTTTYGKNYERKALPACPARDLQGSNPVSGNGYRFARDTNGHQYFYPPNAMGMGEQIETVALA